MMGLRGAMLCGVGLIALALTGCRSDAPLPPVFGAVFGLSGAAVTPFSLGKIPEPSVKPSDVLIGSAANSPGLCIWRDVNGRRFRAACPAGYSL